MSLTVHNCFPPSLVKSDRSIKFSLVSVASRSCLAWGIAVATRMLSHAEWPRFNPMSDGGHAPLMNADKRETWVYFFLSEVDWWESTGESKRQSCVGSGTPHLWSNEWICGLSWGNNWVLHCLARQKQSVLHLFVLTTIRLELYMSWNNVRPFAH